MKRKRWTDRFLRILFVTLRANFMAGSWAAFGSLLFFVVLSNSHVSANLLGPKGERGRWKGELETGTISPGGFVFVLFIQQTRAPNDNNSWLTYLWANYHYSHYSNPHSPTKATYITLTSYHPGT